MSQVSIIINCHNSDEFLRETLESVKVQSYEDYEIILWDNASTDHTRDIALEYDERMKYFYSAELVPLGEARNKALRKCSGEYIAFLDSDDLWEKEKLSKQIEVMETNSNIGLTMTNCRELNMFSGKLSENRVEKDAIYDFEGFITNYAFVLSTFMIRKSLVDRLEVWFDKRFQYAEEYDFFSRLIYGSEAYYIGEPLAARRMHGEMSTIKLAPRIPIEHQMTLDNLRSYIPDFDTQFPKVVRKIEYVRDYMEAKYKFPTVSNKEIRGLVKPYIYMEKRALAYYLMACLPKRTSVAIFKKIYHNSI